MVKWIAGGCLVLVLLVVGMMYFGYSRLSEEAKKGPEVSIMIDAGPERVFASVANLDSLTTWWATPGLRGLRKGMLALNDTLEDLSPRRDSVRRTVWIVDSLVPNALLVMHQVIPDRGMRLTTRRDAIQAVGDSTRVTTLISSSVMDSIAATQRDAGGAGSGMLDLAKTMGAGGARIQTDAELKRLKARIEGKPIGTAPPDR